MASTNVGHSFFDGKQVASKISRTSRTPAQWTINWGQFKGGEWTQSDIAEMIFYNKQLSDDEIVKESDRLCAKYGIPSQKPPKVMKNFKNGSQLRLKTRWNKYVRMRSNGRHVQQGGPGTEEMFTVKTLPQFGNNVIALFGHFKRYLRAHSNKKTIDQSGARPNYNSYPNGWAWERFWVEDVGGGKIALRSFHNTYLRANKNGWMDQSPTIAKGKTIPHQWQWERFTPVFIAPPKYMEPFKNGRRLRLKTYRNRYISMRSNGRDVHQAGAGAWEIFTVKTLPQFGNNVIALYGHFKRYLRGRNNKKTIDQSGVRPDYNSYPNGWAWERWWVEDVGGGKIALRSFHDTYLRANKNGWMDQSPTIAKGKTIPHQWQWERFTPVFIAPPKYMEPFKNGRRLRLKTYRNRYISMRSNGRDVHQAGAGAWEIFTVKTLPQFGNNVIALYGHHKRYLRAHGNKKTIDQSGGRPNYNSYPNGWTWERWVVVDKGGGKIALKSFHNTYLRAHGSSRTSQLPGSFFTNRRYRRWHRIAVLTPTWI